MAQRQLEHLRDTLGSLVDDLGAREEALIAERENLSAWAAELEAKEARLAAEQNLGAERHAANESLSQRLEGLVSSFGESTSSGGDILQGLIRGIDEHLSQKLTNHLEQALAATLTTQLPTVLDNCLSSKLEKPVTEEDVRATSAYAELETQAESLSVQLAGLRQELSDMEALLVEALEGDTIAEQLLQARKGLQADLASVRAEKRALEEELAELRAQAPATKAASNEETLRLENQQIVDLQTELQMLRQELESALALPTTSPQSADETLREELERATCELAVVRSQKEELEGQVAQLQISTAPHGHMPHLGQESLSWEERKRLLIQQLDLETDDTPASQENRVSVQEILATTDRELAARDREIAELRCLVEQQSNARDGVAVGAAAVAQLIESDELVQQEREKLREIQRSWEEKLRQAEIDLSIERAKLARERSQLEEKLKELESQHQPEEPKESTECLKERRWLLRLGLKDEK